jgi:hypothetical protein
MMRETRPILQAFAKAGQYKENDEDSDLRESQRENSRLVFLFSLFLLSPLLTPVRAAGASRALRRWVCHP